MIKEIIKRSSKKAHKHSFSSDEEATPVSKGAEYPLGAFFSRLDSLLEELFEQEGSNASDSNTE